MDIVTPDKRSRMMAGIKGKNTKPELVLRKACWSLGLRYSLDHRVFGRPDFVFPRAKVAVFVDGCFWHGCQLHYQAPATQSEFWKSKLTKNRARDQRVTSELTSAGWKVVRVWEHDLNTSAGVIRAATAIKNIVTADH